PPTPPPPPRRGGGGGGGGGGGAAPAPPAPPANPPPAGAPPGPTPPIPRARASLAGSPYSARAGAFARCWARKEAALKATGVALVRGAVEPYVGTGLAPAPDSGLRLTDLLLSEGHVGAVAHEVPRPTGPPEAGRQVTGAPVTVAIRRDSTRSR
ncbi:4'-phosphopantetheinyl transferase superfamily protein, partial [Streptomyces sp. NPDC059556]|uniref:4'-phosphopantetheinyl transferase superfamily protein n=1 Tax=Streptomyces sp. NPDC059556 TaxID=3346863 RepID=UPI00368F5BDA